MSAQNDRARAVALINAAVARRRPKGEGPGEDVLDALHRFGFRVHSAEELDRWSLSIVESRIRMQDLAEVAIRNAIMRCLLVELRAHETGATTLIVCDPLGDEDALAARIVHALGVATVTTQREAPGPVPDAVGAVARDPSSEAAS